MQPIQRNFKSAFKMRRDGWQWDMQKYGKKACCDSKSEDRWKFGTYIYTNQNVKYRSREYYICLVARSEVRVSIIMYIVQSTSSDRMRDGVMTNIFTSGQPLRPRGNKKKTRKGSRWVW